MDRATTPLKFSRAATHSSPFCHSLPPPRSGHCRQLAPKWMSLAKALKGIVKVGAVNCEADPGLCQEHGVQGYPTIMSLRCVCV